MELWTVHIICGFIYQKKVYGMLLMPRETGAPRQNLQHSRENRQTPHERVESVQTHAAFALIPHYETPSHYTAFFPNH